MHSLRSCEQLTMYNTEKAVDVHTGIRYGKYGIRPYRSTARVLDGRISYGPYPLPALPNTAVTVYGTCGALLPRDHELGRPGATPSLRHTFAGTVTIPQKSTKMNTRVNSTM